MLDQDDTLLEDVRPYRPGTPPADRFFEARDERPRRLPALTAVGAAAGVVAGAPLGPAGSTAAAALGAGTAAWWARHHRRERLT